MPTRAIVHHEVLRIDARPQREHPFSLGRLMPSERGGHQRRERDRALPRLRLGRPDRGIPCRVGEGPLHAQPRRLQVDALPLEPKHLLATERRSQCEVGAHVPRVHTPSGGEARSPSSRSISTNGSGVPTGRCTTSAAATFRSTRPFATARWSACASTRSTLPTVCGARFPSESSSPRRRRRAPGASRGSSTRPTVGTMCATAPAYRAAVVGASARPRLLTFDTSPSQPRKYSPSGCAPPCTTTPRSAACCWSRSARSASLRVRNHALRTVSHRPVIRLLSGTERGPVTTLPRPRLDTHSSRLLSACLKRRASRSSSWRTFPTPAQCLNPARFQAPSRAAYGTPARSVTVTSAPHGGVPCRSCTSSSLRNVGPTGLRPSVIVLTGS